MSETKRTLTRIIVELKNENENLEEQNRDQRETITRLRLEKEYYRRELKRLKHCAEIMTPIKERQFGGFDYE